MIGGAPDATSFLSTTTALVGIFVTIVASVTLQFVFQAEQRPGSTLGPHGLRTAVFGVLLVVDVWGVGFPLYVLYRNTLGPIPRDLISAVLASTAIVIVANIIFPMMVFQLYRSFQHIWWWMSVDRLGAEASVQRIRGRLVGDGYIEAIQFDEFWATLKRDGQVEGDLCAAYLEALFRAFVLGRPGRIGISISRTCTFYLMRPIVRRLQRTGTVTYVADGHPDSEFPLTDTSDPKDESHREPESQ